MVEENGALRPKSKMPKSWTDQDYRKGQYLSVITYTGKVYKFKRVESFTYLERTADY